MAESRAERGFFNKGKGPELPEDMSGDKSGFLRIPLPEGMDEKNVSVVNDIYNKNVVVRISGADEDFYKQNFFSGDMTGIDDVRYGYSDGASLVELKTDRMSVPITEFAKGSLFIKVADLHSVYDRVVVIDAGHGGNDPGSVVYGIEEKNITAGVAEKLFSDINTEKGGTAVYMSVPDGSETSDEDRAAFVDAIDADLLISLHTGADPDSRVTNGVGINTTPELENDAEELCNAISAACGQENLGASEEAVPGITELTEKPYLRVRLGYITNRYEAEKMNSDDYQEKAAGVIAAFVNGAD
ncbi:MAG: N-acetylmuramoyl-L-alanine amidase [Lachnospiraceae bacterium]|nr:N-acetylmuramoyl-L-alanine amidase [Lachnospiraceae bacterium]